LWAGLCGCCCTTGLILIIVASAMGGCGCAGDCVTSCTSEDQVLDGCTKNFDATKCASTMSSNGLDCSSDDCKLGGLSMGGFWAMFIVGLIFLIIGVVFICGIIPTCCFLKEDQTVLIPGVAVEAKQPVDESAVEITVVPEDPPKCVVCKLRIEKIEGKFSGVLHDVSEGKIHDECADKYEVMHADKCASCGKPILPSKEGVEPVFSGDEIELEGKLVHMECEADYKALLGIRAQIKKDPEGKWVEAMYDAWPVDGDPVEVTMFDGNKRKTWPRSWNDLEAIMTGELGLEVEMAGHIKHRTVDNAALPNITEDSVTWPCIQNLIRDCWAEVNGEWKREEHAEEGAPYRGLLRTNTLAVKKEGLAKMLNEIGQAKFIDVMWDVYINWPCVAGQEAVVSRYNRKMLLNHGQKVDTEKTTWPLPFEGETNSITALMTQCGWNADQIGCLREQLFNLKEESGVHPDCSPESVCWPDLQQVFRSVVCEGEWSTENNVDWPPLDGRKVTLRLKILKDQIKQTLEGAYRMYCKPPGEDSEAFSYGLVIENVDVEAGTFEGRPRTEGKYEVKDGKIEYDEKTGRLCIRYDECWPGQVDHLFARVKSNAKFQCESEDGFEQKATNITRNLPDDPDDRVGENAKDGVKKYYLYDDDAAIDQATEV